MSGNIVSDAGGERAGWAYEEAVDRHCSAQVSRLHERRVETRNGERKTVKVARDEAVLWEVARQHVKELHEPRGHELGHAEIRLHRCRVAQQAKEPVAGGERVAILSGSGGMTDAQEARGDGVDVRAVKLVHLALRVNEDHALHGRLGGRIVANRIVRKVVKDLHGQEEAGCLHGRRPVKDAAIDNLDEGRVAA